MKTIGKVGIIINTKKEKRTYSKWIPIVTGIIFILSLIEFPLLLFLGFDASVFSTQQIITTGGIFGASIVFYYNKEKMFNVSRLKIDLIKWEWEFKESHKLNPEQFDELKLQTSNIDMAIDGKIDGEISNAVNEDISVQSYL